MTATPEETYHRIRFPYDPRRVAPWRAIARYLQRWVPANSNLLELGAGHGEFSNSIQAAHKWALDQNPALLEHWDDEITPLIQPASAPLPLASGVIDIVFASNFFEHFTQDEAREILSEAWRVLRPGGRLIVVQPNFRLEPRRYFDDYTHKTIYTDNGFQDFLKSLGWTIAHVEPRFTPFSMNSRLPTAEWLVRLYLASPVRPMAGQFLVIAERGRLKSPMWRGQKVAVIFPTYNEKDSIRAAMFDYLRTGLADEVIVVNNNAAPGTSEEVAGTGATEIFETKQGYGHALLRGIDATDADLIVLSEPDGTFSGHDLTKLLAYSEDVPVVFGTRTSREFIWAGANMGRFLRWGNWAVAKMTELLFNTTILTDMGCTHRLFRREALQLIRPHLTIGGSHFGPQLLMEVVAHGVPFVEIPVNYRQRVGESSVTGDFWKAFRLGMRMIALVLEYRLGLMRRKRTLWKDREKVHLAPPVGEPAGFSKDLLALAKPLAGPRSTEPLTKPVEDAEPSVIMRS